MATTVVLTDGLAIDDTEVYATYAGTGTIKVSLPQITAAGAGAADVAPGAVVTVESTAAGTVVVLDYLGRRQGVVGRYGKRIFRALDITNAWSKSITPGALTVSTADALATGSGAGTPILGTTAPAGSVKPDYWVQAVGPLGVPIVLPAWIKV